MIAKGLRLQSCAVLPNLQFISCILNSCMEITSGEADKMLFVYAHIHYSCGPWLGSWWLEDLNWPCHSGWCCSSGFRKARWLRSQPCPMRPIRARPALPSSSCLSHQTLPLLFGPPCPFQSCHGNNLQAFFWGQMFKKKISCPVAKPSVNEQDDWWVCEGCF